MSRRLTQKQLKDYSYCKRQGSTRDAEGNRTSAFDKPQSIKAQIWTKVDELKIKMYGERASSILNMLYDGEIDIQKGDGICVNSTDKPDYKVIAKFPYDIPMFHLEEM